MVQFHFFALRSDFDLVMPVLEKEFPLQYTLWGNFDEPQRYEYSSYRDFPQLGVNRVWRGSYLVSLQNSHIETRISSPGNAPTRYLIDQLINHDTIVFTPGGLLPEESNVLINGTIGAVWKTEISSHLMKRFRSVFRSKFELLHTYYVGPGALLMLKEGKRLTQYNAAESCDLKL